MGPKALGLVDHELVYHKVLAQHRYVHAARDVGEVAVGAHKPMRLGQAADCRGPCLFVSPRDGNWIKIGRNDPLAWTGLLALADERHPRSAKRIVKGVGVLFP